AKLSLELDPFSPRLVSNLGLIYLFARQYPEAVSAYRRAVELDPRNPLVHDSLADALLCSGMESDQFNEWKIAFKCMGDSSAAEQVTRSATKDNIEKTLNLIARLKLQHLEAKRARGEYVPEIHFVRGLAAAGDLEGALSHLGKACEERNVFPLLLHCDPLYERLKTNPKFLEVLRLSNLLPHDKADTRTTNKTKTEE